MDRDAALARQSAALSLAAAVGLDFLLDERDASGHRYVLCEVNVSSVSPFPPSAIPLMVAAVRSRLRGAGV